MTNYTMRIKVKAWRVGEDGSLPKGAVNRVWWHSGARDPDEPVWRWMDSMAGLQVAGPGDWVVQIPDGLMASTDEQFRACCEEVTP